MAGQPFGVPKRKGDYNLLGRNAEESTWEIWACVATRNGIELFDESCMTGCSRLCSRLIVPRIEYRCRRCTSAVLDGSRWKSLKVMSRIVAGKTPNLLKMGFLRWIDSQLGFPNPGRAFVEDVIPEVD